MLQRSLATEAITTPPPFLEEALGYARFGWFVFPCRARGKTPLTEHGFHDASRDESKVREWWAKYPDANVAIATGPSRLLVIDIDPRHGGDVSLSALEDRCGPLVGKSVKTGGGGEHYYCNMPIVPLKSRANAFGQDYPGIDTRGTDGYVIAPPSVHASGSSYTWDPGETKPCRLNVSFTNLLAAAMRTPIAGIQDDLPIPSGSRRAALIRVAGRWRNDGMTQDAILLGLTAINEKQCRPPLEAAEVEKVASEAGKWKPGDIFSGLAPDEVPMELPPLTVHWASDVVDAQVEYLWANRLPVGALTALIGPPEVGKTFLYCELAAALSVGRKLPGVGAARKGKSLIYHGEDSETTIKSRLLACGADLTQIALLNDRERPFGRDMLPALDAFLTQNKEIQLVVIDPVAALLGGRDENRDTDVRECLFMLSRIAENRNAVVLYLRHLNKDTSRPPMQRILGSGAFGAVPRSVLYLEEHKANHHRAVFHIKNNLGEKDVPVGYAISDGWEWGVENDELDADAFSRSVVPEDIEHRRKGAKVPECVALLRSALSDGPFLSTELERLCKVAGFSRSTYRRAKAEAGVQGARGGEFQGQFYSYIPPPEANGAHPAAHYVTQTLGTEHHSEIGTTDSYGVQKKTMLLNSQSSPARAREALSNSGAAGDDLLDYALDNLPPVAELFGAP